ncbi:MAG: hypothetical protein PHW33_04765 [Candidatus Portnoybacteria bacterium]|nr:hypothetical protein [Candidatus Portnoybacteria bacterium]
MNSEKPEITIARAALRGFFDDPEGFAKMDSVRQKMAVEAVTKKIAETLWATEKHQGDIDWPSSCVKAGRTTGCEFCSDKCPDERKIEK